MSTSERRTAPVLKVRCKSETVDEFMARYAVDFAHDGVFVKTRSPFAMGTSMRFEFQLKDGTTILGGRGRVTWIRETDDGPTRAAGMGLAFGEMSDDARAVLDRIVAARGSKPSRYENRPRTQPPPPPTLLGASLVGLDAPSAPLGSRAAALDPSLLDLELSPGAPDLEPAPAFGLLGSALALSGDTAPVDASPRLPDAGPRLPGAPPISPTPPMPTGASAYTAREPDTGAQRPSKVPSGLFSALTAKPFEIELRRSTPLPLAMRLKATSSAPPAPPGPPEPPARVAPPPPRLPELTLDDGDDDDTTLELSDEAYEPHPAPASLTPPKRGPLSAQVRTADTMGQLTQLIEEAFHATAQRSSRPPVPAEALDLGAFGGTPLQVEEQDIEDLTGAELAGELQREERRSSAAGAPTGEDRLGKLAKNAARETPTGVRALTWILFVLFLGAAVSGWGVWQLGPEALTPVMEPLVEFLRPVLEDLGWW